MTLNPSQGRQQIDAGGLGRTRYAAVNNGVVTMASINLPNVSLSQPAVQIPTPSKSPDGHTVESKTPAGAPDTAATTLRPGSKQSNERIADVVRFYASIADVELDASPRDLEFRAKTLEATMTTLSRSLPSVASQFREDMEKQGLDMTTDNKPLEFISRRGSYPEARWIDSNVNKLEGNDEVATQRPAPSTAPYLGSDTARANQVRVMDDCIIRYRADDTTVSRALLKATIDEVSDRLKENPKALNYDAAKNFERALTQAGYKE